MKNNRSLNRPWYMIACLAAVLFLAACDTSNVENDFTGEELFRAFFLGENNEVVDAFPEIFGKVPRVIQEADIENSITDEELAELEQSGGSLDQLRELALDLDKLDAAQDIEYQQAISEILGFISREDPAFLDRFAQGMQSGDQIEVANALAEGIDIVKLAILELYGVDLDDASARFSGRIGFGKGAGVVWIGALAAWIIIVVVQDYLVVFNVAAAVLVAAAAVAWAAVTTQVTITQESHDQGGGGSGTMPMRLQGEYYINMLTQRLHKSQPTHLGAPGTN